MSAALLATLTPARAAVVASLYRGLVTSHTVANFIRVVAARHAATPLGFSYGPSRFSPLPANAGLFGVLYLAQDLATGSYETIVRDRFDLDPFRILVNPDYAGRVAANVSTCPEAAITLADLTNGNAARYGVPTDVIRYSDHAAGQHFSEFVHSHMPDVDGILYRSRLAERLCITIYDRAIGKLSSPTSALPLTRARLAPTLGSWNIRVR